MEINGVAEQGSYWQNQGLLGSFLAALIVYFCLTNLATPY